MGRSAEFASGNESARQPQFQSVQQQSNRNFQALSVLDNVIPNQNGMGSNDLQRRLVGSQGSPVGRSSSTFDKQLWLRHPEPTNRAKTTEGKIHG
jgi:hypothetical protein